ncbi:MAG: hypothetical protein JXA24_05980, partial [Proteobacteria bacterium]|nr:hypothetical protein [Pseudomonadota bacterium]
QIPSTNNQISTNYQAPNSKQNHLIIGIWCLEFIWNLGFGAWNLFGIWDLVLGIYLEFGIWCLEFAGWG